MKNTSFKISLFLCLTCLLLVGSGLFFSIALTNQFSLELAGFSSSGNQISEKNNSYNFTGAINHTIENSHAISPEAVYSVTYQNIDFVSYSEYWDESKLDLLAHELFNNTHGSEITHVARVELHDENYDEYAGLHRSSHEKYSLPISINRLLPDDMTLDFSALSSVIVLTGADINTTVESMARTLSHEYGHHFTQYYFGFNGTSGDLAGKYASLRKEQGAPIYAVVTDWNYYLDNHMWDIQEIAAEDYVFFMGSPLSKQQIDYLDNSELATLYAANEIKYKEYMNLSITASNAYPHENPVLTPPCEVDGLAEYYYSFVDEQPPEYTNMADYGTLSMQLTQTAPDSYMMTWIPPITYSNTSYTLVAYDINDVILRPIKTIAGDEPASANFGLQKAIRNYNEYTIDDGLDDLDFVRFRIVITFFDGSVYFSEPYDVQF